MSSLAGLYLFVTQILHLVYLSKGQSNVTTTNSPQTTIITQYFTSEPREVICSSNYAFVYIKSSSSTLNGTVLSERTDYPPYGYTDSITDAKVVLYANSETISLSINNPCNISTWTTPSLHYNNTIVLIEYNHVYDTLCTAQQWSLNLQNYGNIKALLIANDDALSSVYTLSGDTKLSDPYVPTRMISKNTATNMIYIINNTSQDIYASINCFNDTSHPPVICMLDSSTAVVIENVVLDGEYQEQAHILVNDHPVWLKERHKLVADNDFYIWLTVNHSRDNNPWRWVIGTDYTTHTSIDIECVLNTTDYIDDPTLCGNNWYRNGARLYDMSSHGGVCNTGDTFICVESGLPHFATHFAGRYRQIHNNLAYYASETAKNQTVLYRTQNVFGYNYQWWDFEAGAGPEALCQITSQESFDVPWRCNQLWIVWDPSQAKYVPTNEFDVDECSHPNVSVNSTVYYPERLCLTDPYHDKSTFYQGYHGIYTLDDTQLYDGRSVYKNQRLNGSLYFLFVDEYDRWVINEQVPSIPIPTAVEGHCDEDVATPDQCTSCWVFLWSFRDELQCNVSLFAINSSLESDCIGEMPTNDIINLTQEITACFDDVFTNTYDHPFTGTFILEESILFNDRAVWSMNDTNNVIWYVYYSERWRYWVIDSTLREMGPIPSWSLICLLWEEYEPWNCSQWYSTDGYFLFSTSMMRDCTFPPTFYPTSQPTLQPSEPTAQPTEPTIQPTFYPTIQPTLDPTMQPTNDPITAVPTSQTTEDESIDGKKDDETRSGKKNGNSGVIVIVVVVSVLLCLNVAIFIYFKKLKKKKTFEDQSEDRMTHGIEINEPQQSGPRTSEVNLLDDVDAGKYEGAIDQTATIQ